MDLIRFFLIFILKYLQIRIFIVRPADRPHPRVIIKLFAVNYRQPMIRMVSPTWAIASTRFFFIIFLFINHTSKFGFCMVRPTTSGQSSCKNHLVCGELQIVADDGIHFTDLAHGALQVLHNIHCVTSIVGCAEYCAVADLLTYRPLSGHVSNAVFQNQIVAVLLHRIDEELLCRNLFHSNTSLYYSNGFCRVLFFSVSAPGSACRSPQGVGIIAPGF